MEPSLAGDRDETVLDGVFSDGSDYAQSARIEDFFSDHGALLNVAQQCQLSVALLSACEKLDEEISEFYTSVESGEQSKIESVIIRVRAKLTYMKALVESASSNKSLGEEIGVLAGVMFRWSKFLNREAPRVLSAREETRALKEALFPPPSATTERARRRQPRTSSTGKGADAMSDDDNSSVVGMCRQFQLLTTDSENDVSATGSSAACAVAAEDDGASAADSATEEDIDEALSFQ